MAKIKINFSKIILIAFLILIAIAIRSIPVKSDNHGDILVHYDWSKTLYHQDLKGIYFYDNWLYTPLTQPPLITLGFWFSRHVYENKYLLSELHNLIKIPPASVILWFDHYGEFLLLRLWAIIGDIILAFFIFWLIYKYKKDFNKALIGFIFILFNPINLFETWIWAQNDIISVVFVYLSFLSLKKDKFIISPLLFLVGLFFKPTCLVLLPFYVFYFFKQNKIQWNNLVKLFISCFICLSFIFISFKPFLANPSHPVSEISNIILQRMSPSSKGLSRASNSAFNFFTLFFEIDKTYGSQQILGLKLDTLGLIFFLLINVFAIYFYIKKNKSNDLTKLSFILFFISQATFLFMTGMLERYFFPAFIASIILMFLNFKDFGIYMIIQNLIWFLNLFYSFYQRQIGWVKLLFESNSLMLIRILSLISLINLFLITKKFLSLKKYSATKSLN